MILTLPDILFLIGVPGIVTLIFQGVYNSVSTRVRRGRSDDILIKEALQALLRDRLRQNFIQYREAGCIDLADKENFDNMYQIYHALGQNGVVNGMHDQIMSLPINSNRYQRHTQNPIGEKKNEQTSND